MCQSLSGCACLISLPFWTTRTFGSVNDLDSAEGRFNYLNWGSFTTCDTGSQPDSLFFHQVKLPFLPLVETLSFPGQFAPLQRSSVNKHFSKGISRVKKKTCPLVTINYLTMPHFSIAWGPLLFSTMSECHLTLFSSCQCLASILFFSMGSPLGLPYPDPPP